jgi:hypothetical protein
VGNACSGRKLVVSFKEKQTGEGTAMFGFEEMGKLLLLMGFLIIIFGLFLILAGRLPYLGHLPGDIIIKRENFGCYIPLATSLLLSLLLTIILNLILRIKR